jgi:hypothetical protein
MLPASGLSPGVLVQCSRCGKQFQLGENVAKQQATSGKAVASLVLGLLPVPLLTGIPAIILGIWALMDIRRHAGQLRGSGIAACGITFGALCSFVCTPMLGVVVWKVSQAVQQMNFTNNPAEIEAIASNIAEFEVPEGLQPVGAGSVFGFQTAIYGDRKTDPTTMILLMKFPAWMAANMAANQQQMQQQIQQQMEMQQKEALDVEETHVETFTVKGQPVQVTVSSGKESGSGEDARQYMAMIPSHQGPIMVMLMTQEPSKTKSEPDAAMPEVEDTTVRLNHEQVKQFFESIQ